MKIITASLLIFASFALTHNSMAQDMAQPNHIGTKAKSIIVNNEGKEIGHASFIQGNQGVLMNITVSNLPAGKHGMHFHEVGTCEGHEHFENAKGHIMPTGKPHGYLHPQGPHEGNLPNLIVPKDGSVTVELYSDLVSLYPHDKKPSLLDADGSVLMIHDKEDDHQTQPIGGSGKRIACGVIQAEK